MPTAELIRICCFDVDSDGNCFAVCHQKGGAGGLSILAFDAKQELLGLQKDGQASLEAANVHASLVIRPTPSIDFDVEKVVASKRGHYLMLYGYQGKDQEHAVMAVVDVYGGFVVMDPPPQGATKGVAPSGAVKPSSSSSSSPRFKECALHHVDPQLYQSRPGLVIYQAGWHPHSDGHFSVLTSDSRFRLYSLKDPTLAEQTFDLRACLVPTAHEPFTARRQLPLASDTKSRPPLGPSSSRPSTPSASAAAGGAMATRTPPLSLTPGGRFGLLTPKRLVPATATPKVPPSQQQLSPAFSAQAAAPGIDLSLSVTSYSYGPPVSWGYFSVYFLTSNGAVYLLCPVCPFGCRVPSSVLRQAAAAATATLSPESEEEEAERLAEETKAWLHTTFDRSLLFSGSREGGAGFSGRDRWTAASSVLEGRSPCLRGPLNLESIPEGGGLAVALHTSYHLDYQDAPSTVGAGGEGRSPLPPAISSPSPSSLADGGSGGFRSCTSCIVTALSDGRLYAHACHGLLGPTWWGGEPSGRGRGIPGSHHQAPQCVVDAKGDIRAVRYECPVWPLSPPSPLVLGEEDEPPGGGGVPCGGLLLLDLVDLQIPPSLEGKGDEEEEEEGEAGPGGVLGPSPGLRRLALISASNAAGGGGGGEGGKGAGGGENAFWAVHESGCWAVDIAWLPALARALAPTSLKGAEGGLPVGGGGLTEKEVRKVHEAIETVPPPLVKELLFVPLLASTQSRLSPPAPRPLCKAAAAMSDLFLGDALVLVQEAGDTGVPLRGAASEERGRGISGPVLRCFMKRTPPPPPLPATKGAALTGAPGSLVAVPPPPPSSDALGLVKAEGGDGDVSEARRQLLEANLSAIYDDLTKPQAPLALPKVSVSEEEDPEGLIHLQACIALMRQRHVEFAHRARQSLTLRLGQLGEEARSHRSSVSELQVMMEEVTRRQAALEERAGRAQELQENLMERAGLLAQLHWSLPRPLSEQEQQMSAELDNFEAKKASLVASWNLLSKRLNAALSARSQGSGVLGVSGGGGLGGGAAPTTTTLPPPQAAKVHSAILDQFRLISNAIQEVKSMEEEVRQWKLKEADTAVMA